MNSLTFPLQLSPEYRDYVWGGDRLRPGIVPTAEAWVIYEKDRIASGPLAGRTLAEAAGQFGASLLGRLAFQKTGARFPLLIKLLDCAQWLSLQVHPDDAQAARLEGPGFFGKTEAWYVLEGADGAQLIAGLKPGTTAGALETAIRSGKIKELAQYLRVRQGDTIFMAPGTIHALGPGLLIYEVQQTSDLTYRVWDWDRPATPQRPLHIEKSLAVANPSACGQAQPLPALKDGLPLVLAECPYFTLRIAGGSQQPVELDTRGESFHAVTVIEGSAHLVVGEERLTLHRFDSAVIPADCGPYRLLPAGPFRVLVSNVG